MSDTNELSQILEALKQTNATITALKSTVEKQAQTIEELQGASAPAKKGRKSKAVEAVENEEAEDELAQLREQMAKLNDQNNKFHAEQRKEKLHKAVRDGLLARGVDPKRLDHAFAFVKDKISMDKAGSMKMVDTNGLENNLEESLDHFCDSPDGNFYKAPVDVSGAGTTAIPGQFTRSNPALGPSKPGEVLSETQFNKWIEQSLGIN
jgi:uncharacterized phage infection (PIP) family protein YhgE